MNNPKKILTELLVAAGLGDKNAFSNLYRLTSPNLYAVALRILKHESSAQDCLQECYISVWKQARSYNAQRAAPMTWLTTIVRNRAIDMLRKQPWDAFTTETEKALAGAQGYDDPVNRLSINKCLAQLQAQQRDCLLRSYYEGLTHPELAEFLQVPVGTVKTWIRRGLEQLRRCLQQ